MKTAYVRKHDFASAASSQLRPGTSVCQRLRCCWWHSAPHCQQAKQHGAAAEIHLRGECRTDGGLVLLADVAEIYATDPDEVKALGRIDLVPAPAEGQKRYLRLREIEDLLVLRGLNLRDTVSREPAR